MVGRSNAASSGTIKSSISASLKGGGQARRMVIDARASGLSESEALRGLDRAFGVAKNKLDQVIIIGDGFFVVRKK